MAKKNYSKYMIGGLALGGLYILTKGTVLGPTTAAAQASSSRPQDAGITPGLYYYISEATEWNDYQIMQPALSPDSPEIIIPYTYNETITYLMARGMERPAAEVQGQKIISQGYPSVIYRLEALYDGRGRTVGDRREIYAHLLPLYNVMNIPNGQRVPLPGATVATTTPTAESVQGMAVRRNVAGRYSPGSNLMGHQTTNRAGNRRLRAVSGMKAWTKDHAKQIYNQRQVSATREMTLSNMKAGMDINLYKPVDTLEIFSEAPQRATHEVDNVGNALVRTRDSMRRLL